MGDKIATRQAYGKALAKFADKYPELVVLDADLAGATKTGIFLSKYCITKAKVRKRRVFAMSTSSTRQCLFSSANTMDILAFSLLFLCSWQYCAKPLRHIFICNAGD